MKPLTFQAKLVEVRESVSVVPTVVVGQHFSAASASQIYLRIYSDQVTGMVREGQDLIITLEGCQQVRIQDYYGSAEPRELFLMARDGTLVEVDTQSALSNGPLTLQGKAIPEPAPFESLTQSDDNDDGLVLAGFAGILLAAKFSGILDHDDKPGKPDPDPDPKQPDDITKSRPVVTIPEAEGGVTPAELSNGLQVGVALPQGAVVGGRVILTFSNGNNFEHVLTAADITRGSIVMDVPLSVSAGNYSVTAVVVNPTGARSQTSAEVPFDVLPTPATGPLIAVTIDPITADDMVTRDEANGDIQLTGRISPATAVGAGDRVEVVVGGQTFQATIGANGQWTATVPGAAFTGGSVVAIFKTTVNGSPAEYTQSRDYGLDIDLPPLQAPELTVADAADGIVTREELADGIVAAVKLADGAAVNDVVVVRVTSGGATREFTKTLTAADIQNGTVSINLGSDYADGNYSVVALVRGADGRTSPNSTRIDFEIDALDLDVGSSTGQVSEANLALAATGQIAINDTTGSFTVSFAAPTGEFTSRGEVINWQINSAGQLIGVAGARTVLVATIGQDGRYTVELRSGFDHPAGSNSLTVPLTVVVTDPTGTARGTINLDIADTGPTVSAPVTLSPTQPGQVSGTLVTDMGPDGGRMESVTIDNMTFTWNKANGTITVSGNSQTVLDHEFDGRNLFVTTVRGETVNIDMQTGQYRVQVTGQEAQPLGNDKPFAGLANTGGLLGLANANAFGLLNLAENQFFTASDSNNDIKSVELSYSSLLNLSGTQFTYDTRLASELGIVVSRGGTWFPLGGTSRITITAADGGTIDNWKLNEFLGTVKLGGGLTPFINLDALSNISIKVTDSLGNETTAQDMDLANVGLAQGLVQAALPPGVYNGTNNNDDYTASDGLQGQGVDNRLYGGAGNDRLNGAKGNDILRGGAGNDTLLGGEGNDVLIGGTGNDVLTGGTGIDVFRFEKGDTVGTGVPLDRITDFNNAGLNAQGDVLDLADLLQGEGRVGKSAGNLGNYLHFEKTPEGTLIHISTNGGYANGFNPSATDQRILLEGVDLTAGFSTDLQIITDLLVRGKLLVDVKTSDNPASHGDLNIGGTVIDGDGDRASTGVRIEDSGINQPANNKAPVVGIEAEALLGVLGGGFFNFDLNSQDLLVADEDNNLAKVMLEFAPTVALNMTPVTFAYDQTMANVLGYEVRVTQSQGVLGIVAPRAAIEITSRTGEPLDNAQINTFLKTVHLVDSQGGLLSSSTFSASLLNAITLSASDVWGAEASKVVGTFLDTNYLHSIGGNSNVLPPLNVFNALEWVGENAGRSALVEFSDQIRTDLRDGLQLSDIQSFANSVRDFWQESLEARPVTDMAQRINEVLNLSAVQRYAQDIQTHWQAGLSGADVAGFIDDVRAEIDAALSGTSWGEWADNARLYLVDTAIGRFAAQVQAYMEANFQDFPENLPGLVQTTFSNLLDGSYLSDMVSFLRAELNADMVRDFALSLRGQLQNGFNAADVDQFVSNVRALIDNSLQGTPLAGTAEFVRQYLTASAIGDFAEQVQAYLETQFSNSNIGRFADAIRQNLDTAFEGTLIGDIQDYLGQLFNASIVADFAETLRAGFSGGLDADEVSDFIDAARSYLTASLDGTYAQYLQGRIGEYLTADAISDFAARVSNYLEVRYGSAPLSGFLGEVHTQLQGQFENSNLGELVASIYNSLDQDALLNMAGLMQQLIGGGLGVVAAGEAFVSAVRDLIESRFEGASLDDVGNFAVNILSGNAIIDFANQVQDYTENALNLTWASDLSDAVQGVLENDLTGGLLVDLESLLRGDLQNDVAGSVLQDFFGGVRDTLGGVLSGMGFSSQFMLESLDDAGGWLEGGAASSLASDGTAFSPTYTGGEDFGALLSQPYINDEEYYMVA